MATVSYLNWRCAQGRETIDQLDSRDFATRKEFRAEQSRLVTEYAMAGMAGAYWSSRACKGWNENVCTSCGAPEGESHGIECETRGFAIGVASAIGSAR